MSQASVPPGMTIDGVAEAFEDFLEQRRYNEYINSWPYMDSDPLPLEQWNFLCRVWDHCYQLLWDIEELQPGRAWPTIQYLEYWLGV